MTARAIDRRTAATRALAGSGVLAAMVLGVGLLARAPVADGLVVVVGAGLAAGALATTVAWSWWRADPTAPHLRRRTVRSFLRRHRRIGAFVERHHPAPAAATAELLGLVAASVVIGAAVSGIVLVMVRTRTGIARADVPLAEWAARRAGDTSIEIVRGISALGGSGVVVIATVTVTVVELLRDRRWAVPAFALVTVGGQFAVSNAIKLVVDRARPSIAPVTEFSGASFPSGHSVAAAATWMCLAFLLGRGRHRHVRAVLFGAAVGTAVAVAATRVVLGVHWTTDVVAGLAVGWVWFGLCSIAFGGRVLHFGRPVELAERGGTGGGRGARCRDLHRGRPAAPALTAPSGPSALPIGRRRVAPWW